MVAIYDGVARAQAQSDYKDGLMPYDNPFQPGTSAFKAYKKELERLLHNEDIRDQRKNWSNNPHA